MKLLIATAMLLFAGSSFAVVWTWEKINPKAHWKDSYSANGKCYIDSELGHGIANVKYNGYTIRQIAAMLPKGPGADGNAIYNDVQCGNGPPNNYGDEELCPGRVDMGKEGCNIIGPKWDLSGTVLDNGNKNDGAKDSTCITTALGKYGARTKFSSLCADYELSRCTIRPNKKWSCYSSEQ